ncbi:hypothetical protein O181_043879 [Austropuccinia psidii MF-1]|uniref:MULE transposase domain-containing protein n=1 Tax=Austropuccinia psidii MF-1 TaxID=1389203 RepID=A0A9Q3DJ80_9BASI|nr:hypothetical protein [Austropuccinia psidii MF-1]
MAHPAFRKFNGQETSQIAQMSESQLMPRKIQAQLCSQRKSDRPVILKDIYNQVKKVKKDKLKGRRPIDALIDTLKEENFVLSSATDAEGHITSLFFTHPLAIKLLHGFPNVIIMDCTYKTNKALKQYIEKVFNNTNIVPPAFIVIDTDLALKNSLKKLFPDSKVMLCTWNINKDVFAHFMKKIGHGTDFENFMGLWNQVMYSSAETYFKKNWKKLPKKVKNAEVLQYSENTWLPLKEYYVQACTNHTCHLGVGSTSRAEGAHTMVKHWLQKSIGTLLEVVRALHMPFTNKLIEIINRISKEMIVHVKNLPLHICALNCKVSPYALQMAFENFKTKFGPNEKCTNKYNSYQGIPCKDKTQKAFSRRQRLKISDFHPQWDLHLPVRVL